MATGREWSISDSNYIYTFYFPGDFLVDHVFRLWYSRRDMSWENIVAGVKHGKVRRDKWRERKSERKRERKSEREGL